MAAAIVRQLEALALTDDDQASAALVSATLAQIRELEDFVDRFSFFVKIGGIDAVKTTVQNKAAQLVARGQPFTADSVCQRKLVNVLFVDTETTGVSEADQAISVCAILVEVDSQTGAIANEVTSYHGFREPSCEISGGAFRVHGMTRAQLVGKSFDTTQLVSLFGVASLVVAHNAKFDRRMLCIFDNPSRRWGCSCWDVDWPREVGRRSLDDLCCYFGVHRPVPHDALTDTRAMIAVLQQTSATGTRYLNQLLKKHRLST